jgi:8-oxo-dGTP diphosphatase
VWIREKVQAMSWSTNDIVKVAVGILINAQNEVLVALRPQHNPHGGLWEFPGGKFEVNETLLQAMCRELNEEVGIEVTSISPLLTVHHDYGAVKVELNTWRIEKYNGVPYGREGQEVRWVSREELLKLDFPEGNRIIVDVIARALEKKLASA